MSDANLPQFVDPVQGETYARRGWVVLRRQLSPPALGELRSALLSLRELPPGDLSVTVYDDDPDYRAAVSRRVLAVLEPVVRAHVHDADPLFGAMLVKRPGFCVGYLPPHQDWTFVDESRSFSFNVWAPLQNIDLKNGQMYGVPGSHRIGWAHRAPDGPSPLFPVIDALRDALEPMQAGLGDVVFHAHSLIHASGPNFTGEPRVAVASPWVRRGSELVALHHAGPGHRMERFVVDRPFHLGHRYGTRPVGARLESVFTPEMPCLDGACITNWVGNVPK